MGIINYLNNQHIVIYIGEVLPRSDMLAQQATDYSYLAGRIGVGPNFTKFTGKYLWWNLTSVTFQAASYTPG